VVNAAGTSITFHMTIGRKAYLNFPFIWLHVRNPAPGFGSITPMRLTVVKSCGSTTC
jgi:hypothetical protein